jgi:hypothetical protein
MRCGLQQYAQLLAIALMRSRRGELLGQAQLAQAMGFDSNGIPQQYLPVPFQMLQPLPLLPRMLTEDELCAKRLIIGSLDACVKQRLRYRERLGANYFPLRPQEAGLPQEQVLDAIPLFGERVSPQLRDV